MIVDGLIAILLVGGSLFMLLAAIGIVRFPDMLLRMHASAKASAFGTLLMLAAVSLHFRSLSVAWESFLVVGFIFLTTPIASHIIGRVAHIQGLPLWKKMKIDECKNAATQHSSSSKN